MNKYSFRLIGTFDAEDYAKAQAAVLAALASLTNARTQSIELSQWEVYPEEASSAKTTENSEE